LSKNVLLLGSSGWIGTSLRIHLENTPHITLLTLPGFRFSNKEDAIFLQKYITTNNIKFVINTTRASVIKNTEESLHFVKNLSHVILKSNAFLIHFGSAAEYGPSDSLISENFQPNPQSSYGILKALESSYLKAELSSKANSYLILRPFNVCGREASSGTLFGGVIKTLKSLRGNSLPKRLEILNPDFLRDFIHLSLIDTVTAKIVQSNIKHLEVLNLCSSIAVTIEELHHALIDYFEISNINISHRKDQNPISKVIGDDTKLRLNFSVNNRVDLDSLIRTSLS